MSTPPVTPGSTYDTPIEEYSRSISSIALSCLKELSFSLVTVGSLCPFFPAHEISELFFLPIIQISARIFSEILASVYQKSFSRSPKWGEWVNGVNFTLFTGMHLQSSVHELGHALCFLTLYQNADPRIELSLYKDPITRHRKTKLSMIGKKLGAPLATAIAVGSGPFLTLLVSGIVFALGLYLRKTYPMLSKYMIAYASFDYLHHVLYAYSALNTDPWNLSHDFAHLAIFGLHPWIAIALISTSFVSILFHRVYTEMNPG